MVSFTVAGLPRGWQRAGARIIPARGNRPAFAQIYTPPETRRFELAVARYAMVEMKGMAPFTNPVRISILIGLPIAPSLPKYRQRAIRRGHLACTNKPDEDNVAKAIKDAMNKVVYADDSQIVISTVIKDFTDTPRVSIRVTELVEPEISRTPEPETSDTPDMLDPLIPDVRTDCGAVSVALCPRQKIPGATLCNSCQPRGKKR